MTLSHTMSHKEYTSHVEAVFMSRQIECHSASRGKPPHGSHPTQTNCWQLEKGNTCNNDNPKAVTPPKKGNTTHATMTPQKLFLATPMKRTPQPGMADKQQ